MSSAIINYGSINIDYVYNVSRFVRPGETIASRSLDIGLGGKGANQSVAIARAGASVMHIGRVSKADHWSVDYLASAGVNVDHVEQIDGPSGHAVIQVDEHGENAIVLHGGANHGFALAELEAILESNRQADYLLMQNECNLLADIFALALAKGIKVVLNPAPMTHDIKDLPLRQLDTLVVNQSEAQVLCGVDDSDDIIRELMSLVPTTRVVLTLGSEGAVLMSNNVVTKAATPTIEVADTTGAGDTFVGYFLAGLVDGLGEQESMQRACKAASIAATRAGAIVSIPKLAELA